MEHVMLLVTSALSLGLGRHALPAWQIGDVFWLALLLAIGAFAVLALSRPNARPIAAGASVSPRVPPVMPAGVSVRRACPIGPFAPRVHLAPLSGGVLGSVLAH